MIKTTYVFVLMLTFLLLPTSVWAQSSPSAKATEELVSKKLIDPPVPSLPPASSAKRSEAIAQAQTGEPNRAAGKNVDAEMQLNSLIREALANNPQIQAAERLVDAKRAVAPQQRTLPDPTISAGWTGNPDPPFSVQQGFPPSARMVGITQPIPFPGKLALKGRIVEADADSDWWNYQRTKLDVISQVKQAYYDLFYIDKAIETVQKDKDLLEKLEKIAEARYAVGKGNQQDVIRAQVEISKLLGRLTTLDQRKGVAKARLRNLLYRRPDSPIGTPSEVTKTPVAYTLSELEAMAEHNAPELRSQESQVDKSQLALQLAKKDYYPDFGVGFAYYQRPMLPDSYQFNVTAKLPLYFWKKQRYGVEEAAERLGSSRNTVDAARSDVFFKIKDQYLSLEETAKLMDLYSKAIVPQASLALDSSLAGYQVGSIDFLSMLTNFLNVLEAELSYYEQLADYQKTVARLEPLVGTGLTK